MPKANIIQSIGLHFPSFSVLGKEIEFGRPGMYVGAGTSETILVICCEHLTELRLLEEAQVSQDVALLTAPGDKANEKAASSDEEESEVEELEEESVSDKVDKTDITNVITFKKIKEDIKQDVEVMIEKKKISKWSSIREIVRRRKLKKLGKHTHSLCFIINKMCHTRVIFAKEIFSTKIMFHTYIQDIL